MIFAGSVLTFLKIITYFAPMVLERLDLSICLSCSVIMVTSTSCRLVQLHGHGTCFISSESSMKKMQSKSEKSRKFSRVRLGFEQMVFVNNYGNLP